MTTEFLKHEVEWTREKAERVWAFFANRQAYFSDQVGDAIIYETLGSGVSLSGRVLDYGCGPGYFLEKLIHRGIACEGAEFSSETVESVKNRLSKESLFRDIHWLDGECNRLPTNAFDIVFFIETLEHVLPGDLKNVLQEVSRIIKPKGHLILTTPNEEDIEGRKVICPDCGCIFHRVQHVSSWSVKKLTDTMKENGFKPVTCRGIVLRRPSVFNKLRDVIWRLEKRFPPHLLYIGSKE